ncbi:Alanine aminotransferase 2 [Orchesella cincta]|uniref:alanine transaminase n=1 Tax=Orchesella cincta TaxID=48709 RepID=A0A1D2MK27_ORCCI|nr:Alanine aminotransferase 2 [Orchesella cincta]
MQFPVILYQSAAFCWEMPQPFQKSNNSFPFLFKTVPAELCNPTNSHLMEGVCVSRERCLAFGGTSFGDCQQGSAIGTCCKFDKQCSVPKRSVVAFQVVENLMSSGFGGALILSYGTSKTISVIIESKEGIHFNIRATQIPCDSTNKAPDDCLQYFTSSTAAVKSFGFPRQLNNQRYTICVKPSTGGSLLSWSICTDEDAEGLQLSRFKVSENSVPCLTDWIAVDSEKRCGQNFTSLTTNTGTNSRIRVNFDENESGDDIFTVELPDTVPEPMLECSNIGNPQGEQVYPSSTPRQLCEYTPATNSCLCRFSNMPNPMAQTLSLHLPMMAPSHGEHYCPTIQGYTASPPMIFGGECKYFANIRVTDTANTDFGLLITQVRLRSGATLVLASPAVLSTVFSLVLALISCPELMELSGFNEDVKRKARDILSSCRGGSAGSYSDSRGMQIIRKHVAKYIEKRDGGIAAHPDDIILSAGASEGIRACLKLLKSGENVEKESYTNGDAVKRNQNMKQKAAVLIPVPEYPLYSATLEEYNMKKVPYYLDEHEDGWDVNVQELETIVEKAREENCEPRAVVVINPGNPTGHILPRENMEAIIRFAYQQRLVLLADEVYQDNVYGTKKFLSFKKVLSEMEAPYNSTELISVHSCSKGFVCECGLRAGYFEVVNMDPDVKSVLTASVAANLCPTVLGQAVVDCLVDPPKETDPSYELFMKEKSTILNNLAERAELAHREFNAIPGISCAQLDGAMYAFPRIYLPEKAIRVAKEAGYQPDVFYSLSLLDTTGICVVPGSGMGQMPGTYHFRTTILASTEKMKMMLDKFRTFHLEFVRKYSE